MSVALKQNITAWIRINVVSLCFPDLAKCYHSWQLSLAWGVRRAVCAALGKWDIAGQGGSTALPAAPLELCLETPSLGAPAGSGVGCGDALSWERISFMEQKGPESSPHLLGMVEQGELCCGTAVLPSLREKEVTGTC